MAVPILKQQSVLIATIPAALSDQDLVQFRDELADRVGRQRIRGVVVDVTALDVLDSFASRTTSRGGSVPSEAVEWQCRSTNDEGICFVYREGC